MTISRRSFLGGATGAAIVGGGAWAALIRDGVETAAPSLASTTTLTPSSTTTTAAVAAAAANAGVAESLHDRVLVVLELAGGNDALNTLVPDLGRYHDARPLVGLGDAEFFGLNQLVMRPGNDIEPLVVACRHRRCKRLFGDGDVQNYVSRRVLEAAPYGC